MYVYIIYPLIGFYCTEYKTVTFISSVVQHTRLRTVVEIICDCRYTMAMPA